MFNLFKKQPIIGIDISDYSIEVLWLGRKKEILAYGREILQQGIVQDGKILNKENLAAKLKEALKNIKANKAILSLPESKVFIGDFKVIPWKLEEVYTDEIDDLQIAAPKEIVNQYIEVMKMANIEPVVLDIESLSLARALLKSSKDKISSMIIDIGARTTNASIFNRAKLLVLSITIPIAGNHFTKAIADKLKIQTEQAEALKIKFGFNDKKSDNKILSILQASFQPIIKELKQVISYYENTRSEKIQEIILAGGSALLPKIDEYLAVNLEKKVMIGDPLKQIGSSQLADKKHHPILFANVIGLALRGIGDISAGVNLLPQKQENIKTIKPKSNKTTLVFVFLCACVFLIGFILYRYIYTSTIQQGESPSATKVEPISESQTPAIISPEKEVLPEIEKSVIVEAKVVIQNTPTGWLNAREGPGMSYAKITQVKPGEIYPLLEEKDNWYKIKISGEAEAWITSQYAIKQ